MANGRLYLRNKKSGELLFIGKSFGEGYYLEDYTADWIPRLNRFYERAYVASDISGFGDDGAEAFEIINEQDIKPGDWVRESSGRVKKYANKKISH